MKRKVFLQKKEKRAGAVLGSFFAERFFRSSLVQWSLVASLLVSAACWGLMGWFIRPVDFPIILHYNVHFGVDMIGAWWQAYLLPLAGLLILGVNTATARLFFAREEKLSAMLLLLGGFAVQVAVLIAAIGIVRINY
ncbi:MAG TPA: hypothetical protein PKA31_02490 [Candidatus Moranbacteria bacterium]|nr:hypothetical protein [Candidatus Moranbacteria bacterium]